jgi:hypothetical protein
VQSVRTCGMTPPEGAPDRNQGGVYATNALLLKAERYSQLIRVAADVLKLFSVNVSLFSVIVSGTEPSFSANAS